MRFPSKTSSHMRRRHPTVMAGKLTTITDRCAGGGGERWDFMQLTRNGADDAGDRLREKILMHFQGGLPQVTSTGSSAHPLATTRQATMQVRGADLDVLINAEGTSWAKASELLDRYEIPFDWNAESRRILLGVNDIFPKYLEDQVDPNGGFPTFQMALQGNSSPIILVGVIHNNTAYCRVLEFAQELGITASFNPFALQERRGG